MHINIILHKLKKLHDSCYYYPLFTEEETKAHREINLSKITKVVNSEVGIQTPDVCEA